MGASFVIVQKAAKELLHSKLRIEAEAKIVILLQIFLTVKILL